MPPKICVIFILKLRLLAELQKAKGAEMKVPYGRNELFIVFLGLDSDRFSDKEMGELINELEKIMLVGKNDLNKSVAEFHGISVEQLIASQNYKLLCDEYKDGIVLKMVAKIKEKLGFTDKEA